MTRPRVRTAAALASSALLVATVVAASPARAADLQPFYDLPNAQHPESVTYDPVTRDFFAGSVLGKGIVRVDGDTGASTQFVSPLGLPFLSVPAVSAILWVGYFIAIYGAPDPSAPYGPGEIGSFAFVPGGGS